MMATPQAVSNNLAGKRLAAQVRDPIQFAADAQACKRGVDHKADALP
jgi:hypothetical protein